MFQEWTCSFLQVGGVQQVFVDGARAFVVPQLAVGHAGAVNGF
jgi:hypothetical protein